jgi:hypothetical protein
MLLSKKVLKPGMGFQRVSYSWERLFVSIAFAALAAGIFSVVVLIRDHSIAVQMEQSEKEQAQLKAKDEEATQKLRAFEEVRARLELELKTEKDEKLKLAYERQTAINAAKVAGGVLVCTAVWDLTAFLGNPFAVPGFTDNAVCGVVMAALGSITNPSKKTLKDRDMNASP